MLAVCLAESCISQLVARETPRLIGAQIDFTQVGGRASSQAQESGSQESKGSSGVSPSQIRIDALLFGETQSRVVITCNPLDAVKVVERAKLMGVPAVRIGTVSGDKLTIKTTGGEFGTPAAELHDAWWNSIARAMD